MQQVSVLAQGEGRHLHFLNNLATIKVSPGSDGSMSAVEFLAPKGFGPPLHCHRDEDELGAVPPMAQNIEVAWERPELRYMFERFGSFSRWVQFNKRGTGASDHRSQVPGLDERVEDVRANTNWPGLWPVD